MFPRPPLFMGRHSSTAEPLPYLCVSSSGVCLHSVGSYKNIFMLESVQKFAYKVCLKRWGLDYDSMLHLLGITRLSTHWQFLKLVLLYRAVNGLTYFPPGIFVPRSSPTCPVVTWTLIYLLIQIMLTAHLSPMSLCIGTTCPTLINHLPQFLYSKRLCMNTYLLKIWCLMFVLV